MTELIAVAYGVLTASTLFDLDALHSAVHVINLLDRPCDFRKDELAKLCVTNPSTEVREPRGQMPNAVSCGLVHAVAVSDPTPAAGLSRTVPLELITFSVWWIVCQTS